MAETYKLRPGRVEALRYDSNDPSPAYGFLGLPADCEELSRQNAADCERRHAWLTGYGFAEPASPAILRWRGERQGFTLLLKGDGRERTVKDGMWLVHGSDGWSAMGHAEFIGKYEPAAAQPADSPAPDIRKGNLRIVEIREQWAGYARHVLMEQEGRGSVLLDIHDEPAEHGCRACIHGLYVREDSRGRGIGRMLMGAAEGIVRKSGCGGCVIHWSASSGEPALAWYSRRGYRPMRAELAKEFPAENQDGGL